MTLAEFAQLLDVHPKWALNAMAALSRPRSYSIALARQLALARAVHEATGSPLVHSFAMAERILCGHGAQKSPVDVSTDNADVRLQVDLDRIFSTFNVRLSVLRTRHAPRQRGRPISTRRDSLQAATDWGTDLSLLADNLRKTPEERIRQLDRMASFAREVRRLTPSET